MATFIAPRFIEQEFEFEFDVYSYRETKTEGWFGSVDYDYKWIKLGKSDKEKRVYHNSIVDFDRVVSFRPTIVFKEEVFACFHSFAYYTADNKPTNEAVEKYKLFDFYDLLDRNTKVGGIQILYDDPKMRGTYWFFEDHEKLKMAFDQLIEQIQYRSPE